MLLAFIETKDVMGDRDQESVVSHGSNTSNYNNSNTTAVRDTGFV